MSAYDGNYAVIIDNGICSVTSVCSQLYVGIGENDFGSGLLVYPNPTDGQLKIDLGCIYSNISVMVYNTLGQNIFGKTFGSSDFIEFNIKGESGVYIVDIRTKEGKGARIQVVKK